MKKFMLALFLVSATLSMVVLSSETMYARSGGGNSNTIPPSQVPKPVKKNFKAMYPTATQTEWEYKPVYYGTPVYTASFSLGTQKWEANYTADGIFVSAYPKV